MRSCYRLLIAACLTFVIDGCAGHPVVVADSDQGVGPSSALSVVELIDGAGKYDGQLVSVRGHAETGFEACILWSGDPDHQKISYKYALWYTLENTDCSKETGSGYATIKGYFNWSNKGHLGSYAGTIERARIEWERETP